MANPVCKGKWLKEAKLMSTLGSNQKLSWRLNDLKARLEDMRRHLRDPNYPRQVYGGPVYELMKPAYLTQYRTNVEALQAMVKQLEEYVRTKPMRAFEVC